MKESWWLTSKGSQGDTSGSLRTVSIVLTKGKLLCEGRTHTLLLETLYNRECPRVMNILHDNPIHSLLVLAVDSGSLDQLGLDAVNGIGLIVGIEVDSKRIDHFETRNCWIDRMFLIE